MNGTQRNTDLRALNLIFETFVQAAIHLSEKGKKLESNFTLKYDELRTYTGRERLREEFLKYVLDYFKEMGATIQQFPEMERFRITINLLDVALNSRQACMLVDEWKNKEGESA